MRTLIISLLLSAQIFSYIESDAIPYLLPESSPIKAELDAFFSQKRWTESVKSLKKGGFKTSDPRAFSHLVVASHPQFPGYIFKIYVDAARYYNSKPEYHWWILRVKGADQTRELIRSLGLDWQFKVPSKWIYQLPGEPAGDPDFIPKNYILVEEDMQLVSNKKNKEIWRSSAITFDLLSDLYSILTTIGLLDCCKIDNIPFSEDGRIAFIDTQTWGQPVHYDVLVESLSKANRDFWLIISGLKKP